MNRAGTVLVVALLAVLAMELVALSAFGFARVARLGSLQEQKHAMLEAAAEDILSAAIATIDARDVVARGVGPSWEIPVDAAHSTVTAGVTAQRVSARLLLVEVRAESGGMTVGARALLRMLPPAELAKGLQAVITTALPPGPVEEPTPADSNDCGTEIGLPPAMPAWRTREWADSLPFGDAGGIGWVDLAAMAAASPVSSATPPAFVVAKGDTILAGEFEGLLIGPGNVTLAGDARVRGILLVRGVLTVRSGANLDGVARALALQDEGGTFAFDRCAVADALAVAPLRRAYRPPQRWRLPVF